MLMIRKVDFNRNPNKVQHQSYYFRNQYQSLTTLEWEPASFISYTKTGSKIERKKQN